MDAANAEGTFLIPVKSNDRKMRRFYTLSQTMMKTFICKFNELFTEKKPLSARIGVSLKPFL